MCACSYSYLQHRATSKKYTHVRWIKPFGADTEDATKVEKRFGMDSGGTSTTLALHAYLDAYGKDLESRVNPRKKMSDFDDWRVEVPFATENVSLPCCPEDRRCEGIPCHSAAEVCPKCEVPVCHECLKYLNRDAQAALQKVPPQALANDMMVFYAPTALNEKGMTIMEMMCSSVCITSMICFSMGVKHGHMLNSETHATAPSRRQG
jgi:hypothetical protein